MSRSEIIKKLNEISSDLVRAERYSNMYASVDASISELEIKVSSLFTAMQDLILLMKEELDE
jgi:hypothetical protein